MLKKILSSSLWLLIGNSVGRLAMFLANIFAARILSQEEFGQFAMIRNTISSVEGLASGTLGSTIIKKVAETDHNNKEKLPILLTTIFIINFVIALLLMAVIFFNTDFIVEKFFIGSEVLVQGLYIGLLILLSSSFATLTQNILIGFEEYKKLSTLSIITSIISIPAIFFLIHYFKFNGALFGIVFYFSLDFILKYLYYKKLGIGFVFNLQEFKKESKKILLFSTPLLLAVIVNSASFWYARVLLINETNSFEEIAIFDAAYQWLTIIMVITHASSSVLLPKLSGAIQNSKKQFKNIMTIGLWINIIVSIIIAIIFSIFSKEIMAIYGDLYTSGSYILITLSVTSIFFTVTIVYNRIFIALNKQWIIINSVVLSVLVMYYYILSHTLTNQILANGLLAFYMTNSLVLILSKRILHK